MPEWEEHVTITSVQLIDGTRARGPLMRRRKPDGSWEYRRMTTEEETDYVSRDAW